MTGKPAYLKLYRSRKRLVHMVLNLLMYGTVTGYFLYGYQHSGSSLEVIFAGGFAVLTIWVLWNITTRKLLFEETDNGFSSFTPFGGKSLSWDQLHAMADRGPSDRVLLLVWKETPDDRERYLVISKKLFEQNGLDKIEELVRSKRPNLLGFKAGKVQPASNKGADQ